MTYDFEAGQTLRSSSLVAASDASYMVAGDVLGVLYEPGNPPNNTIVYR